jgi:hypothetical protein
MDLRPWEEGVMAEGGKVVDLNTRILRAIQQRLGVIEGRLGGIEGRMTSVERAVEPIPEMQRDIHRLVESFGRTSTRLDRLERGRR